MRRWMIGALLVLLGSPALAFAHDEAKTPVTGSIILEMSKPSPSVSRERAYDEALKGPRPAPPKSDYQVQPDGSVRYGNTTVIIRHDCPPGGDFFEPPPLPGRRR